MWFWGRWISGFDYQWQPRYRLCGGVDEEDFWAWFYSTPIERRPVDFRLGERWIGRQFRVEDAENWR